jgi:hypothetical protein
LGGTDQQSRTGNRQDRRCLDTEGRLSPTSIEDVIVHLNFAMTKTDSKFLVDYIRWRMDHPIAK